jgi:hypothetical protein
MAKLWAKRAKAATSALARSLTSCLSDPISPEPLPITAERRWTVFEQHASNLQSSEDEIADVDNANHPLDAAQVPARLGGLTTRRARLGRSCCAVAEINEESNVGVRPALSSISAMPLFEACDRANEARCQERLPCQPPPLVRGSRPAPPPRNLLSSLPRTNMM